MSRDELIMHIDDKMNEALGEYYTKLSGGGEYDYNGDITPEESIVLILTSKNLSHQSCIRAIKEYHAQEFCRICTSMF